MEFLLNRSNVVSTNDCNQLFCGNDQRKCVKPCLWRGPLLDVHQCKLLACYELWIEDVCDSDNRTISQSGVTQRDEALHLKSLG